jgi:RNA polymerase sigma factor (sigma-70 family)
MSQDDQKFAQLLATDLEKNFALFLSTYRGDIFASARRWTRNDHDAEDVVQETFIRAFHALKGYRREKIVALPLKPWLFTIARNSFLNMLRSRNRRVVVQHLDGGALLDIEIDSEERPERIVESEEQRQEMLVLIARLPPQYGEVLLLHYFEDQKIEEIANRLDKPPGTIKSDLYRGRGLLREIIIKAKALDEEVQ